MPVRFLGSIRLLVLSLAGAAFSACGESELRRWTETSEPEPARRELVGFSTVVSGADFRATGHEIAFEIEAVYATRGLRRQIVKREFRRHDPFVEAGEMTLGLVLSPLVVASVPFHFVVVGPLLSSETGRFDVIDWLATIPESLLDPTENDLFPAEPEVVVESTRDEPYEATVSELQSPASAGGGGLSIHRVRMALDDGTSEDVPPDRYRLEGNALLIPEPPSGIVSYEIDLSYEGRRSTVLVRAE